MEGSYLEEEIGVIAGNGLRLRCGCSPNNTSPPISRFLLPNVEFSVSLPSLDFIPSTVINRSSCLQHLPASSQVCPTALNASKQLKR